MLNKDHYHAVSSCLNKMENCKLFFVVVVKAGKALLIRLKNVYSKKINDSFHENIDIIN